MHGKTITLLEIPNHLDVFKVVFSEILTAFKSLSAIHWKGLMDFL